MPSFLAYHIGLMSHLGSTFSKNDGPGPCPGGRNFDIFLIFPKCPKKGPGGPGGPWGALGGPGGALGALFSPYFPPFFPPWGAPYFFLLYHCDIPPY